MSSRRSEVSTALNDLHMSASFSSHLHGGGGSSSSLSVGSAAAGTAAAPPTTMMGATAGASVYTGSILMQGKLMRRDRTFLTWKWRDFTLERTRLQYFSEKGNRKGEIALTPTTPITIRLLSEPKPHSFLLFIKDEKLTLAALNENEQRKWIDVFCDVFHASVEQAPSDKADRRPTFLPIPDIAKDKAAASAPAHVIGGGGIAGSSGLTGHVTGGSGNSMGGASGGAGGGAGGLNGSAGDSDTGGAFPEVIPILESRMTYGPMKESYSRVTFPPSLANGDLLVGVGPIVRRMGWTDERILAVGLYIDPEGASKQLERFHGRTVKSLYGDQSFYDHVLAHTTFRRSFVITARKRVSKSVLTALLHDELAPRMGTAKDALDTFLGFIERSLKKAESMVLRLTGDGRFEYRLRGTLYPPIASHALCKCIQAMLFDSNAIQHDAKRGLIERLPSLWGSEALDAQDEIFGRVSHHHGRNHGHFDAHGHRQSKVLESESESEYDDFDDLDEDDFDADDFYDDDDDDDDNDGHHGERIDEGDEDAAEADDEHGDALSDGRETGRVRTSTLRKSRRSSLHRRRTMSRREELDDRDNREHEDLRRASRSVATTHLGPMLDPDSNVHFSGALDDDDVDASALLGTWSQVIAVAPTSFDQPHDGVAHRFTVALYAEPGGASETLLKYKGLSVGSIVQDPDFFARFAQGAFRKHLVFKVDARMRLHTLIEHFDAHLQTFATGPNASLVPAASPTLGPQTSYSDANSGGSGAASETTSSFLDIFQEHKYKQLLPRDEVRFSIDAYGRITLVIRKRASLSKDSTARLSTTDPHDDTSINGATNATNGGGAAAAGRSDVDVSLPSPPFAMLFQSLFYGYHTIDSRSRTQLMQRLPSLLDLAKDDLVHTYHDEIQVLKENYKRQRPENRVKVGYMAISFEKKKLTKTIDGVQEPTAVPSRWSKRWCRLDGVVFSYFSHKRSRKARDVMDLTACDVAEITSLCGSELAPFAVERDSARPSIKIAITKASGEILALRTESIYEGEEWLESLTDASKVRRLSDAVPPLAAWESSIARLRRSSSVHRNLRGATPAQLDALKQQHGSGSGDASGVVGGAGGTTGGSSDHDLSRSAGSSSGNTEDDNETELLDCGSDDDDNVVVDKEASLVLWVREDPRHSIIAFLLVLVVWLASNKARGDTAAVLST